MSVRNGLEPGAMRRGLRRAFACAGVLVAVGGLVACGSDNGSEESSGSGSASSGGATEADIQKIKDYVKVDTANSGKGETIDVGAVLALSGSGASYGKVMANGMKLAGKQIEQLGGPKFNMEFLDHKSGDPGAGAQAAKKLGIAKTPLVLASYTAGVGSMLPAIDQYKMLTLDGGGGTSVYAQGKPFFYGMRAIPGTDPAPGLAKYTAEKLPDVKKVAIVSWDTGALNESIEAALTKALTDNGLELAGKVIRTKIGASEYSSAIQQVRSQDPDMVWLPMYGTDPGNFVKQAKAAGLDVPIALFKHEAVDLEVAGPALSGTYFATDYFDPREPANAWAETFIKSYKDEYGEDPDSNAANYYEDMFAAWTLVQRVLADKGEVTGKSLEAALAKDPTFPSVYGGDGETPGELAIDLKTHSTTKRPMVVAEVEGDEAKILADFDNAGAFEVR